MEKFLKIMSNKRRKTLFLNIFTKIIITFLLMKSFKKSKCNSDMHYQNSKKRENQEESNQWSNFNKNYTTCRALELNLVTLTF